MGRVRAMVKKLSDNLTECDSCPHFDALYPTLGKLSVCKFTSRVSDVSLDRLMWSWSAWKEMEVECFNGFICDFPEEEKGIRREE